MIKSKIVESYFSQVRCKHGSGIFEMGQFETKGH